MPSPRRRGAGTPACRVETCLDPPNLLDFRLELRPRPWRLWQHGLHSFAIPHVLADRGFKLLQARAARPAGFHVRAQLRSVPIRQFAVKQSQQIAVLKMRNWTITHRRPSLAWPRPGGGTPRRSKYRRRSHRRFRDTSALRRVDEDTAVVAVRGFPRRDASAAISPAQSNRFP